MADSSSVLIPEATGEVVTGLGVESDEDETVQDGVRPEPSSGLAKSLIETSSLTVGDISIAERARKNSRRDVEQQLVSSSIRFLKAFGAVNEVSLRKYLRPLGLTYS